MTSRSPKMTSSSHPDPILARLGAILAPTWAQLGSLREPRTLQKPRFSFGFWAFSLFALLRFTFPHLELRDAVLAPSWVILGPSWALLGVTFGPSWRHLGPILASLGPPWGLLGASLGSLLAILGPSGREAFSSIRPWSQLGPFGRYLGPSLGPLGPILGLFGSLEPFKNIGFP